LEEMLERRTLELDLDEMVLEDVIERRGLELEIIWDLDEMLCGEEVEKKQRLADV